MLLGLTAALRAKPENAGPIVGRFANQIDPRIRAAVGNTLARLKLNEENEFLRKLLPTDPDAVVRANAARVLGATEQSLFSRVTGSALKDEDSRVRVSAIRALGSLKDARAAVPLMSGRISMMGKLTTPADEECTSASIWLVSR